MSGFSGAAEVEGRQGLPADKDALRQGWVTQSVELISLPAKGVPLYLCFLLHCSQPPPSLVWLPPCISSPLLSLHMIRWWGICQQHYTGSGSQSIESKVSIIILNYLYAHSVWHLIILSVCQSESNFTKILVSPQAIVTFLWKSWHLPKKSQLLHQISQSRRSSHFVAITLFFFLQWGDSVVWY